MKAFFGKMRIYSRFLQASLVMYLDQRLKRDPKVADRMRHLKAQQDWLELMMSDPKSREKLPAEMQQNYRLMGPMMRVLEQGLKKNPDLTMKQMADMAKNPQLQEPRIRTRPGPPQPGRRRF